MEVEESFYMNVVGYKGCCMSGGKYTNTSFYMNVVGYKDAALDMFPKGGGLVLYERSGI